MNLRTQLKRMDWLMVSAMFILLILGTTFIYSAGRHGEDQALLYQKQMIWAGLGLLCFFGFALTDYQRWIRMSWWIYALGLILLALVLEPHIGLKVYGARRWIQIAGFRLLQPAELMKLAILLMLARLFGQPGRNITRPRYVMLGLALTVVPMLLIMRQPDLGTALIFPPLLAVVMFVAGVPRRVFGVLLTLSVLLLTLMLGAIALPLKLGWSEARQERTLRLIGITPYQRDRILVFIDSDRDPLGAGWNKAQAQIAVGSGRLWGKGFTRGTQNMLGYLPRTVAPNDFIFSVIAEEKGFVGSLLVLALFGAVIYAGLKAAALTQNKAGRLLCAGVVTLLFGHVLINVAMTIGLMPITGIPLPLLSYGGTFMVSTMTALGLTQSVRIRGEWS